MSKSDTLVFKGIAILMMLFTHLFNHLNNLEGCFSIIEWGGIPIEYIIARALNPVPLFLFLGGYGLYKVWGAGDNHKYSRIFRLYVHYWTILIFFIVIGHILYPKVYPGSISLLLRNLIAIAPTYNKECWFLFPYVLLSLVSPILFNQVKKYSNTVVLFSALLITLIASFLVWRFPIFSENGYLFSLVSCPRMLFAFMFGAIAARQNWVEQGCNFINNQLGLFFSSVSFVLFFIIMCLYQGGTLTKNCIFVFAFIILFKNSNTICTST